MTKAHETTEHKGMEWHSKAPGLLLRQGIYTVARACYQDLEYVILCAKPLLFNYHCWKYLKYLVFLR